jgi:HlyD family secretion protein
VKILIAAVVAVAIVGTGITIGVMKYGSSNKVEATSVRVEPVSRGDLVEIVSAPGQVQPKTKVQISARVAARIKELPFDEGAQVKAGDVLVRLDATELEAQLKGGGGAGEVGRSPDRRVAGHVDGRPARL